MSNNFKLFVSCDKASHTCDKTQYNEASLWEKIRLNIHLIYCKACRKYSSNNGKLTKLMYKQEVEYLKPAEKEILQKSFKKELENAQ